MIYIVKKLVFSAIFVGGIFYFFLSRHHAPCPQNSAPIAQTQNGSLPPAFPQAVPSSGSLQIARSLLGLEVKFQNGDVHYPGLAITNDPRYQALNPHEKLVDAIRFQPLRAPAYLLLLAIAKGADGRPSILPGKFDIIQQTPYQGLVLKDFKGRVFYYSGYVLTTPAWKNLPLGQSLQDQFCKDFSQNAPCSAHNTVKFVLTKPSEARKEIPLLALIQ